MKAKMAIIACDSKYGCDQWAEDYWEATVSSIDGAPVSQKQRAPGWLSTEDADYCPSHLEELGGGEQ